MSRRRRARFSWLLRAGLLALGSTAACSAGVDPLETGPGLPLQIVNSRPSCFVHPPKEGNITRGNIGLFRILGKGRERLWDRNYDGLFWSDDIFYAVRADPFATRWRGGGFEIEPVEIAEDYQSGRLRVLRSDDAGPGPVAGDVVVTPDWTHYVREDGMEVWVSAHAFRIDDYVSGCDPERGVNFETVIVLDGVTTKMVPRCWAGGDDPAVRSEDACAALIAAIGS